MNRRGLSTLELVLALPILLGVMALMINFGTAASWKVRASIVARQNLWESRSGRASNINPPPDWWPGTSSTGGGHIPELDDPRVDLPVARGPKLSTTHENEVKELDVDINLLDPTRGLRTAAADLNRKFPMLSSMGSYNLTARSALLDRKFAFYRESGLWYHGSRRTPIIYTFQEVVPEPDEPDWAQAYITIATYIYYLAHPLPDPPPLSPLDRDDEFQYYNALFAPYNYEDDTLNRTGTVNRRWSGGSPEFHPSPGRFCDLDHEVARTRVEGLIDRIQGADEDTRHVPSVAERMTRSFISLYTDVLEEIENLDNLDPPFPPQQAAALRAQAPELQQNIDTLNQFLSTLN